VAVLTTAARTQRDSSIASVPEADLTAKPARGEHNPTADLGFVAVPEDASQLTMLHETISQLSLAAIGAIRRTYQAVRASHCSHIDRTEDRNRHATVIDQNGLPYRK
jgi:hypothetical protein